MTEPLKKDRAHFPKGEQQKWILGVRKQASIQEIATLCSCSERTIRDWQRERFHMDYSCLKILCKTYSLSFPAVKKVAAFAHTSSAGKLGGKALIDRYGKVPVNEAFRKQCWQEWWVTEGVWKQNAILQPKKITTPHKSEKLAEFIGIMLGDGTVAPYHIAVTLHAVDDVEYSQYVSELISFLFHVQPKVYYRKDAQALNIVVARKELTEFLHVLGLPKGNKIKQGVSIPAWILHNDRYAKSCVRGLMDTDGSVFTHKYKSKGITYLYKKLSFTSASPALVSDILEVLKRENIRANVSSRNIRIGSKRDVVRYFKVIGSSNPKHLKRLDK